MSRTPNILYRAAHRGYALLVDGLLIVTTPLVEKNPAKIMATHATVVLSMARVVILGFAAALLRQIWKAGIAGWPDATLSMSVVLALPIVAAMDRVSPHEVIGLARTLVGRFGHGGVRAIGSVYTTPSTAPSKFDDHRFDDVDGGTTVDIDGDAAVDVTRVEVNDAEDDKRVDEDDYYPQRHPNRRKSRARRPKVTA